MGRRANGGERRLSDPQRPVLEAEAEHERLSWPREREHLRLETKALNTRASKLPHVMLRGEFTDTVSGGYWPNHEWLAQIVFCVAYAHDER